jgi:hypothetical protein
MSKRSQDEAGFPPPLLSDFTAGAFMPSSVGGGGGSKAQRHAVGNWPCFVHIQLPGLRLPGVAPLSDDDAEDAAADADAEAQLLLHHAQKAFADCRRLLDPSFAAKAYFDTESSNAASIAAEETAAAGPLSPRRHNWAHVSLARPFALRKHEIEPFVVALRAAVGRVPTFGVSVAHSWRFLPSNHDPVLPRTNGNRATLSGDAPAAAEAGGVGAGGSARSLEAAAGARSFAALSIATGGGGSHAARSLARVVAAVDGALAKFGRPPYFDPPHWHVTFAEVAAAHDSPAAAPLHNQREVAAMGGGANGEDGAEGHAESDEEAEFHVQEIEVKAGHLRFALKLMSDLV